MNNVDAIVAGAGIWGCTVARRLAETGRRVLVLDKRAAVGGNCRCEIDPETGIEVHAYGSHVFHTSNEEVWSFVNRFAQFNDYRHRVLACTKKAGREGRSTAEGKWLNAGMRKCSNDGENGFHLYHLPIGKTLLEEFFGVAMNNRNLREFLAQSPAPDSTSFATYGDAVFDAFIRGYTSKQWGVAPEKVDPSVIARLKVRDNYSTDYFDDPHQGIPIDGYNAMFERMLEHPKISVQCNCSLCLDGDDVKVRGEGEQWINSLLSNQTIYYSGPIDALLNYKYGALPWRTLRFEQETLPIADYQGNSVVNYTDADVPFTRIHEFKHYHPELSISPSKTVIMREYSATWQSGDEPYYPINSSESAALLAKYRHEIEKISSLVVGGRLGEYQYLDMDKSIAAALTVHLRSATCQG